MKLCKLDAYDYILLPGVIRIKLIATNDPDVVDIFTEIENAQGKIYVEGCFYSYLDNYRIYRDNGQAFMDLDVVLNQ